MQVTGDANEEQIFNAGEAYIERPEMLKYLLNDIFNMFRVDTVVNVKRSLDIILRAMNKYVYMESIQISGRYSTIFLSKKLVNLYFASEIASKLRNILLEPNQTDVGSPYFFISETRRLRNHSIPETRHKNPSTDRNSEM